jgi:hypothetical protein
MKNNFLLILALLSFGFLQAQTVKIENLKTPDSPGFQILDVSPSSIEKPLNPKALGATLLSLANDKNAIPKNFALEFSLYWYFKDRNASVHKYLNIEDEKGRANNFSGILNKLSVSIASVYSDTTSGSLLAKTNYLSFGLRTNLFTYRSRDQNDKIKAALVGFSNKFVKLIPKKVSTDSLESLLRVKKTDIINLKKAIAEEQDETKKNLFISSLESNIKDSVKLELLISAIEKQANDVILDVVKKEDSINYYLKELDQLPLIQVDGAFAYSEAFADNTTAKRRFNRSGVWINASFNLFSIDKEKLNDNLSAIFLGKYISDNILTDEVTGLFKRQNAFDFGIKVDYTVKDFSLSFEHINRKYNDSALESTNRNVFMMQYKISDGLYLSGSYGKNFGEVNNLFSLFGINYGFGATKLKTISE